MRRHTYAILVSIALVLGACSGASQGIGSGVADATAGAPAGQSVVKLPPPEKTSIKLALSAQTGIGVLGALSDQKLGFFKKYGLDVELVPFGSASSATQALIAGQVDASTNSAGNVIATVGTSSPLVIAYVRRDNLTDILVSRPDIKTAADLKGKPVGFSSFGSQSHAVVLLALQSLGLTDKDVLMNPIGDNSLGLAALKAGSLAATTQKGPLKEKLQADGFNILVDVAKVDGPGVPTTSLVFPVEFTKKYPNTVLALVAAETEGLKAYLDPKNLDREVEIFAANDNITPDDARQQIEADVNAPWHPLDGRPDPATFEFAKRLLVATNPKMADVDAKQALTTEFVDKLRDLGFYKQLGLPGY
jgi:ABC-type nitrate/sulfonate/bicarbonate transport system substrate-binding protein